MQLARISKGRSRTCSAFTLIELMTVVTIIAVLASVMLAVIHVAQESSKRNRAAVEIEAMENALQEYEAAFGEYPAVAGGSTNPEAMAKCLYQALSGDGSDMIEGVADGAPSTGVAGSATDGKYFLDTATYDREKVKKGNRGFVHGNYFVQDPWGNPYRYQRAGEGIDTQNPTFDLWSLGTDKNGDAPEKWIANWQ